MRPVKGRSSTEKAPVGDRLAVLLALFSPWEHISLTYRQLAAELGAPVTEAAVKKWPHRRSFPADAARLIVAKARERGLSGVTLEWVMWGEGQTPERPGKLMPDRSPAAAPGGEDRGPHGRPAALIAQALEADLSHNEFGQWSSPELQHTVIWALKDLARRLRVLRFDMGETFKLTDEWAARVGLPVRPPEQSVDDTGGGQNT